MSIEVVTSRVYTCDSCGTSRGGCSPEVLHEWTDLCWTQGMKVTRWDLCLKCSEEVWGAVRPKLISLTTPPAVAK